MKALFLAALNNITSSGLVRIATIDMVSPSAGAPFITHGWHAISRRRIVPVPKNAAQPSSTHWAHTTLAPRGGFSMQTLPVI